MTSAEKILVMGPSWIGDMVMAQSLFIKLKQSYPGCHITVMAPEWSRPLLDRMLEVDESIPVALEHGELKFATRRRIGKSLRPRGFTMAFVLPNSFKSALIPFHAGIKRRIGWQGEWRRVLLTDCRKLDESAYPLMVQRFVALAGPSSAAPPANWPQPQLVVDKLRRAEVLKALELEVQAPILVICPGAEFGGAKQWPASYYAALAQAQIDKGWQVWILGSRNDRLAAESVQADIASDALARCVNLTGRTSLAQAIDLMSLARVVVSNDSGLMHIAAALARPVVGIFGSTSPDFTPPLTEKVELLATDIECRPCFKRECPYGHLRCLTGLKPELAISAVAALSAEA